MSYNLVNNLSHPNFFYISRNQEDKFQMEILDPVKFSESEKGNKELITRKINQIIEEFILRDPSQWILTHNRWK